MPATLTQPPPPRPATDQAAAERPLRVLALPAFRQKTNPYNRLLYRGVEANGATVADYNWTTALAARWDVVHVHWPEYLLRSRSYPRLSCARRAANLAVLRQAKRRGAKLVWTVHNLKPHGLAADTAWSPYADFLRLVDGCLYLSADSRRLFEQRYPAAERLPGFVVPHGLYDGVYPSGVAKSDARRRLGLPESAIVAASVGGVERYKNLVSLVESHAELGRDDLWLLIGGRPANAALERELNAAAAGRGNVRLHLRFLDDDELQHFFAAADFCVAPYGDILNSGAILLALTFGRPVLCPAIGSLKELQRTVGDDWLLTYEGPFNAAALASAAEWSRRDRPAAPNAPELGWDRIGRQTLDAYRAVLAANP